MEHTNEGKQGLSFKDKLQVAWVILIFLLIGAMLFSVIKLGKNVEVLKSDPITYGVEHSDLSYCNCYDFGGRVFNFPELELKEGGIGGTS